MNLNRFASIAGFRLLIGVFSFVFVGLGIQEYSEAQRRPVVVGREQLSGKVVRKTNHSIDVLSGNNEVVKVLYQDDGVDLIPLGEGLARLPAKIRVTGMVSGKALRKGLAVQLTATLSKRGVVSDPISKLKLLPSSSNKMKVTSFTSGDVSFPAEVEIKGIIEKINDDKMDLKVPRSDFARNKKISIKLAPSVQVQVDEKTMREVKVGDEIKKLRAVKFSGGHIVAADIKVDLSENHKSVQMDPDDVLMIKYRHFDDEPKDPREIRSEHFIVKTDLSDRSSKILMDKLERMFSIVSKYYGVKKLKEPIYCYVADDLKRWSTLMNELKPGLDSIQGRAGVTVSIGRRYRDIRAIVYSCGKHKVVQHEAVHGFCRYAFGSTGPTWYSEGMAELGCYWRPGELEVNLDPVVISYLTSAKRPTLQELVRPGQTTGDSWQAYAWRWALCYLLVNNPNYNKKFYELGVGLMKQKSRGFQDGAGPKSFYKTFKDKAPEIVFEYQQFLEGLENGYRADLCRWIWNKKPLSLKKVRLSKAKILGKAGWQPSRAKVEEGQKYELVAKGTWSTALAKNVSADGDEEGNGKLIGSVLIVTKLDDKVLKKSYELSDVVELGEKIVFTAPATGHLYLRCKGRLSEVAKNSGELTVYIRRKK